MEIETLQAAVEQASLMSLAVGFAAGFLFSFNPVALAAIPVSLAYATKAQQGRRVIAYGAMFVFGMLVTHLVIGVVAGLGGGWIQKLLGRQWGLVLGPLLILLGLMWAGWVRLALPQIPLRGRPAGTLVGASALGAAFSVAVCPFCTPALLVLVGVTAAIGSPLFGAVLLLAFAIGRALPVVLGAWIIDWLKRLTALRISQKAVEIAGGIVLILSGLYMLNAYFFVIPELAS